MLSYCEHNQKGMHEMKCPVTYRIWNAKLIKKLRTLKESAWDIIFASDQTMIL